MRWSSNRLFVVAAVLALGAGVFVAVRGPGPSTSADTETACAPGTISVDEFVRREERLRHSGAALAIAAPENEVLEQIESGELDLGVACISEKHPEPFGELMARAADTAAPRLAGMGNDMRPGAFAAAAEQRATMEPGSVEGTAGTGRQYGEGPLDASRFGTASLGIPNSAGRVDDLEYDAASGRLFAAASNGGAWMSTDLGESWVEVNGDLPSTIVGSLAWNPTNGGRLLVVTGDGSFGGITGFPGVGAWYTDDIGDVPPEQIHWEQAAGVPVDALGFKVAVDQSAPNKVYVATSKGLFRSTDGGSTFTNANLPTGACAGVVDTQNRPECQLANVVTDVVVQAPGGRTGVPSEPKVAAAVGWRGGNWENPDGTVQSEGNGIYLSTDGGSTFAPTAMSGFAPLERRGRIELGEAFGPEQDHNWLFAMVQDSLALNGAACAVLDAPEDCSSGVDPGVGIPVGSINTVIDGVYASSDFGETWSQIANTETFQNPASGSALNGTAAALGFQPGVQAWYNQFVAPDPGPTDPITGAPTRLAVGLEEVWENTDTMTPSGVPPLIPPVHAGTQFRVVGRYFAGETCGFLDLGAPACPLNTQDPVTGADTTHPDQHSAIWLPQADGSTTLFVGGDGGVFRQSVPAGGDLDNTQWGAGANQGFQTLLPYAAAVARDGRAWFGMQDNGTGFIDPNGVDLPDDDDDEIDPGTESAQFQTFGGDGFFVAVDPKNSDVAYYETPGASMNVTTDGGRSSSGIDPPASGGPYRFNNVFVMDPNDALQLATAGSKVYITEAGPATTTPADPADPELTDWHEVFDLGTSLTPGSRPDELASNEVLNAMSAMDIERNAAYLGFCGVCDILNSPAPFRNGIATNVNGDLPDIAGTTDGWHIAAAEGLPNRFITSIAIDPTDVRTMYVTLGGYSRKWASPGTLQDTNPDIGDGHVFRSTDAGETFTDWSGNLPDATATWVELRGDQLVVGTDVGAFASRSDGAPEYAPLEDLPTTSVGTIQMKPHDPNSAIVALYGRGVWEYTFADTQPITSFERLSGKGPVETAVEVSKHQFDDADTVVIATKADYADALASVSLAAWLDAPILLTSQKRLDRAVATEITRLGAEHAVVVSSGSAVAARVDGELEKTGLTVERIGGADRSQTAALLASRLPVNDRVYLVAGRPGALTAGPVAAEEGLPILYTEPDNLPANTAAALDVLDVTEVIVVGGTEAVSQAVRDEVAATGATVREVAGKDRFETSSLLAQLGEGLRLTDHRLWLAGGTDGSDSLAAGAAVSANGGTLLLVPPADLGASPASSAWIADHCDDFTTVNVLGNERAIDERVVDQIKDLVENCEAGQPQEIPPLVGEQLAAFGFETDAEGWTSSGTGPGQWMLRPPGDDSGQAWRVEPYLDQTTTTITSPPIEQPGGAIKVSMALAHFTEEGFDFVTARVQFDDGTSTPLFGISGTNASWPAFDRIERTVAAPPGPVTIAVTMSSDQLVSEIGAAVDNVVVER